MWLVVPGAVVGVAAVAVGLVAAVRRRWLLTASLLGAASVLLLVTGWLLADPGVSRADALKTGGLAGGAVLGQYALWINDRRRRTEEARQEVEQDRAQQDRDRVSDERFARAVEMLGHNADQVRVGALHALAGLARSRPSYTQTVLDVLCSYLRRPFTHPSYELRPDNPDQAEVEPNKTWPVEEIIAADQERQVRLTAQRLVADLLPIAADAELPGEADAEPVRYDLDLTAATVEYLDLTGRQLGRLIARRARLHGASRLAGIRVRQPALFTGAVFHGRTDLSAASLDGGLSLESARILGLWQVQGATVRGFVDLRAPAPHEQVGALTILNEAVVKLDEDGGWSITSNQDPAQAITLE
jgi:hypothetical protein